MMRSGKVGYEIGANTDAIGLAPHGFLLAGLGDLDPQSRRKLSCRVGNRFSSIACGGVFDWLCPDASATTTRRGKLEQAIGLKNVTISVVLFVSLVVLFSCGSSSGLSGEYVAIEHFTDSPAGEVSLDLQKDGTVLMKPLNNEGTYTIDGDTVIVQLEYFDLTFTKDGDKLNSSDETAVYQKQ
jgi:hypothetical protein